MSARLRNITTLSERVASLAAAAQPAFAKRLEARLQALLGDAQIDPTRLAQEAAIAAERADVSEELARLRSHVQQFDGLLAGAPDVGKKLDFLLQEMQREANTLLSKSPGTEAEGIEITQDRPRDQIRDRKIARTGAEHRMKTSEPLVLIVSGPSGSGKSTLVKKLLELAQYAVVCFVHNAIPACDGKPTGNGTISSPKREFEQMVARGDFLEYAQVFGKNWYGTPKKSLEEARADGS